MTVPRLRALHRHWERHPRVEWLVAGYLEYKPKVGAPTSGGAPKYEKTEADLQMELASLAGIAGVSIVHTPRKPKPSP